MSDDDTIAAIATAPGQGGVGIVRISGENAREIAVSLLSFLPEPRYATYADFCDADGGIIDQGIALFFAKPNSFTGEDVIELQAHGGPVVMDRLLKRAIELGARQAKAGEFSERAFHNDKIDLVQAEAIADLIAAESEQSAIAAMHSLQGEFSSTINELLDKLTRLRVHVESALDFPEEEIDFLKDEAISMQLQEAVEQTDAITRSCQQGRLLREGLKVVITGKPNAGKSSLLNRLAGTEAAIVSDVPGTTRDVLREHIQIEGVPLHVVDTAGLREARDDIEREGVRRAQREIEDADLVIRVIDVDAEDRIAGDEDILVLNKIDKYSEEASVDGDTIRLSAKTGDGVDHLRRHILDKAGYHPANRQLEGMFTARRRHIVALDETREYLDRADDVLRGTMAGELLAEELRLAQSALSEITGEFSSDDLLGKIFSEFCIGK